MAFGKKEIMQSPQLSHYIIPFEAAITKYANCQLSKRELISSFPFELYDAYSKEIKNATEYRSAVSLKDRNMEVAYISGLSGSGKTLFAKYIAQQLHYDVFISGTGEDLLDNYDKEECIILDDFRASTMRFNEFLKFTDNNTNATIRSRYHNKDISKCKLMIITSIYKPYELYSMFSENTEQYEQFARRIKHKFYIVNKEAMAISISGTNEGDPKELLYDLAEVYYKMGVDPNPETNDSMSLLNNIGLKRYDKEDAEIQGKKDEIIYVL